MLLVCIFIFIIFGIIIVKRPITIIWMGRYIRNKPLLLLLLITISQIKKQTMLSGCENRENNNKTDLPT